MKSLSIQLADQSHIDTISFLESEYFHHEAFSVDSITDDILNKKTYVIESGSVLVAYFTVEVINRILYLANIVINEKHRGNGYGKFILDNIVLIAKMNGLKLVGLHVATENETALHMYTNYGFNQETPERIKNYYPDRETAFMILEV
jgi:ribosomal protein S18 acetylase RimI-like enzyme